MYASTHQNELGFMNITVVLPNTARNYPPPLDFNNIVLHLKPGVTNPGSSSFSSFYSFLFL